MPTWVREPTSSSRQAPTYTSLVSLLTPTVKLVGTVWASCGPVAA